MKLPVMGLGVIAVTFTLCGGPARAGDDRVEEKLRNDAPAPSAPQPSSDSEPMRSLRDLDQPSRAYDAPEPPRGDAPAPSAPQPPADMEGRLPDTEGAPVGNPRAYDAPELPRGDAPAPSAPKVPALPSDAPQER